MSGEITVSRNDAKHRYEAIMDGEVVAFSEFRVRPGQVVFTHTETTSGYEGKGIASTLAKHALADVQTRGDGVVPLCPFIKSYIERHPEYSDLVQSET